MSNVTYHQTNDMEAAVRSLAARHNTVLVLMDYKSVKPIRMRTAALLGDLDIEGVIAWNPKADEAVERWRRRGGIMQYRSIPNAKRPNVPPADAILFIEAPMQWDRFEHVCLSARQAVVIYRPPTWELHTKSIDFLYPPTEAYATLEAYLDALQFDTPSEYLAAITRAEPQLAKPVAFTGEDLCEMMEWEPKQLKYLLKSRYRLAIKRWHPYKLMYEPKGGEKLWAWNVLKTQPSPADRIHMLRYDESRPKQVGLKRLIKLMVKEHYLVRKDPVYVADAKRNPVDYEAVEAVNQMHRARWRKVRDFVDDLPEYEI